MGLLDWLRGRKGPELDEVLAARESVKLPPRKTMVPGAPPAAAPAGLAQPSFAGAAAEQLSHDLHEIAATVSHPADRLYVSTLIRAVKNDGVELPAMPEDVLRIQKLLASPDCEVSELARAIRRDPAISAKFIAVANSPIYRRGERVNAVEDAAVRVGLNQATAIVMAIVSRAKMFRLAHDREEATRLHRHALAAAVTARLLARGHAEIERDAFIAGMLHDLGRVFMLSVSGQQYRDSRGEAEILPITLRRLTSDLHAGFSALVAERWGFSRAIVGALQYHHLPMDGGADVVILVPDVAERLTYTIAAADIVAHVILGEPMDPARVTSLEGILKHLATGGAIEEVVADAQEAYEALVAELGDS